MSLWVQGEYRVGPPYETKGSDKSILLLTVWLGFELKKDELEQLVIQLILHRVLVMLITFT